MHKLAALHRWLKARKGYALAVLAMFPELWANSAEVQAYLPPVVVSHLAAAAVVIRFALNVRANVAKLPPVDDTDQAGA